LKPQSRGDIRPAGESSEESQLAIEHQPEFLKEPSTGGSPIKDLKNRS
jgi:hypothetical protein